VLLGRALSMGAEAAKGDTGIDIAVHVQGGPGPAVAWVHGYTMNTRVWRSLWHLLPDWTHVGIDLPGHGHSRPLSPDERLDHLGRQVADVCEVYGVRHLIGLSFGGTVALQAAIEAPRHLQSLVLGAPALVGAPTDPASEVRYSQLGELYAQFGPGPHMTRLWMSSPPAIFRSAETNGDLWTELQTVIDQHGWRELGNGAMRSLSAHVQRDTDLRRIQANTLVVLGADDMPAFKYSAALIAHNVPVCRVMMIPEAGHLCLLERPEVVAPLIDWHLHAAGVQVVSPPPN
jgi:pimeloyl-ACP methyl ester carboxylesterase